MNILLIGNFAPDRQESMLRLERMLAAGLRDRGHAVEVWSPVPLAARLLPNYRYGGAAKYLGYFDKFVAFPARVRRRLRSFQRPDVVHILDHANAVYAPLFADLPCIATCHDLLQIRAARGEFPQHRLPPRSRRYQEWILRHIAALPFVVCDSTQTREDLQRLTGIPGHRTAMIPIGLNHPYRPLPPDRAWPMVSAALHERGLPTDLLSRHDRGFIVNVGGGQWYKNRRGLLDIYAALRSKLRPLPRLVMVGKPLTAELADHARSLGLGESLISLQNVSNAHLEALYSVADALLFPSWQEGFGWPVAEAQACGCPVFTSNRAPMTEVGGDGADYIDPADPLGAAERIAAMWPHRREFAVRGLARSFEWQPDLMVTRYLERYTAQACVHAIPLAS
jgi:glycosyltransferase involved in cell wall biosynthesis